MSIKKLSILAAILALALPASAVAAAPTATTGGATGVTSTTATVTGSVNPNKEQTTYHFEYGATTAYGQTSGDKSAGKGAKTVNVSADLSGLAPGTTYHYRLVATNPSGTATGADMTFTTLAEGQAPPGGNAVTIAAKPKSVSFGHSSAITGQVTGEGNGGVKVTLQSRPAGVAGAQFDNTADGTTDAAGNYSFGVVPTVNTEYQVVAKTKPDSTSPIQLVKVRFAVTLNLSDSTPRRGKRVKFSGTVTPNHDGAFALIQRRNSKGKFRTVSKALLTPSTTPGQSLYAKRVRIRRSGVYRVRVPHDAQHAAGNSRKRRIRVH